MQAVLERCDQWIRQILGKCGRAPFNQKLNWHVSRKSKALAEAGFYREVRVKGFDSMLTRTLIGARRQLSRMTTQLSNQIRGVMKTFGLIVPDGKGSKFNENVRNLLAGRADLATIVLPLLEAWQNLRERVAQLGTQVTSTARQRQDCRLLMSIPGIGAITATSFVAAIEDPDNFRNSRWHRQLV